MKHAKKKKSNVGTIKILAEREVPYVEMDIDMDETAAHNLAKAGWIEIQLDRDALINYAFNKALKEFCEQDAGRTR